MKDEINISDAVYNLSMVAPETVFLDTTSNKIFESEEEIQEIYEKFRTVKDPIEITEMDVENSFEKVYEKILYDDDNDYNIVEMKKLNTELIEVEIPKAFESIYIDFEPTLHNLYFLKLSFIKLIKDYFIVGPTQESLIHGSIDNVIRREATYGY